jgi:signal transduction histidine kinase
LDGFVIDITAEREAEARMRRVANLYAALSECNEAIIRIDSRDKLYREVCRIAVDFGRLRMAWIGCVVDGRLRPAASFGARVDYVEHLDLALDPALAAGRMPSADAVLSGNHAICNDIERDAESTPWRDRALACGFRAGAAFPVRHGGVVVGNLTVYAMEPGFFDEQLVKLLDEMALDVSFAVDRFAQAAERRRAEAEILRLNVELERRVAERTAQLKISNRDLESFSYTVSHDLRAPLRAINGFANMLVEGEAGRLSPEGLVLLDRVMANTHKMGELIDNILEYSRIGRARLTPAPTDLQRLVEDVVNELRPAYPASDVVIHPLPQASVDPIMMRQVFSNLIGNALKFSAKSSAPRVEIGSRLNGDGTEFYVRDNGAGFDMKYAEKLFGMFQRMHGANEFPGTGVGLAIVKRLIERHGGSIRAEAAPGKGATFGFVLGG